MAFAATCTGLVPSSTSALRRAQKPFGLVSAANSRTTVCPAVNNFGENDAAVLGRRAALAAVSTLPAVMMASKALALIPDDDDEDLVEKAKAKRKQRLAEEKTTERVFAKSEGYAQDAQVLPVQKAVNELARAGSQLKAGDLSGLQSTLGGSWVRDLDSATRSLGVSPQAKTSGEKVRSSFEAVQAAASSGSISEAKSKYVALVAALQQWTQTAGIGGLKGL